jgi:hypothetical protein
MSVDNINEIKNSIKKYEEELNKSHNETIIEWFLEKIDELKEKLKNTN